MATEVLDRPVEKRAREGAAAPVSPPLSLLKKLVLVRQALGDTMEKSGTAPAVMGGFKFIEWDVVAGKIGTLFAEYGIVLLPSVTDCEVVHVGDTSTGKPIYRATVKLQVELHNADDTQDSYAITWVGTGDDNGDKAVQKAVTSATKYSLLKLFLLGGADDSDRSGAEVAVTRARNGQVPPSAAAANLGNAQRPSSQSAALDLGERGFQVGDPCPTCAELGINSTFVIAKGGPLKGMLQCAGKLHDGTYANHPVPETGFYDDTEVPF